MDHLLDIRAGDEIIYGKLQGVRLWGYSFDPDRSYRRLAPRNITSFQHDIEWVASRPTVDDQQDPPTIENERGLNVYKTEADALRGSADAINGVLENLEGWANTNAGIVLGAVDFWGPCVEHEFGYAARHVQPTCFLRAWGTRPEQIVDDLNVLWFTDGSLLSFEDKVLLAVQRGNAVCTADIGIELRRIRVALTDLEERGYVSWKKTYDFGGSWKEQLRVAWEQGECLHCNRPARTDGACAAGMPRLWQITAAGQNALLTTLRQRG